VWLAAARLKQLKQHIYKLHTGVETRKCKIMRCCAAVPIRGAPPRAVLSKTNNGRAHSSPTPSGDKQKYAFCSLRKFQYEWIKITEAWLDFLLRGVWWRENAKILVPPGNNKRVIWGSPEIQTVNVFGKSEICVVSEIIFFTKSLVEEYLTMSSLVFMIHKMQETIWNVSIIILREKVVQILYKVVYHLARDLRVKSLSLLETGICRSVSRAWKTIIAGFSPLLFFTGLWFDESEKTTFVVFLIIVESPVQSTFHGAWSHTFTSKNQKFSWYTYIWCNRKISINVAKIQCLEILNWFKTVVILVFAAALHNLFAVKLALLGTAQGIHARNIQFEK
jgi:hypothetical protein